LKAYLAESPIGLFALNAKGKIVEKVLFTSDKERAITKLKDLQSGKLIDELSSILKELANNHFDLFVTENAALAQAIKDTLALNVDVEKSSNVVKKFREKLPSIAVDLHIFKSEGDFDNFVRGVTIELAKAAVSTAAQKRDLHAVQAVRTIDDMDKTLNLLAGRIREWYGLHFPELDRLMEKHDSYIRLVSDLGKRDNFSEKRLQEDGIPEDKATAIAEAAKTSMGAEVSDEDLEWLRSFCKDWSEQLKFRERLAGYVEKVMNEAAPNMTALAGPVLSARLVSIAGGLENLAKMPASTIQVLGAEKALFRSLRTGARPPKHGAIFQYGAIHQSPRWQRGKIARALSGGLAIAARLDFFGGEFRGDVLQERLSKKVKEIAEKYKAPPVRGRHGERKRSSAR
jgi:nucleolar protein 56